MAKVSDFYNMMDEADSDAVTSSGNYLQCRGKHRGRVNKIKIFPSQDEDRLWCALEWTIVSTTVKDPDLAKPGDEYTWMGDLTRKFKGKDGRYPDRDRLMMLLDALNGGEKLEGDEKKKALAWIKDDEDAAAGMPFEAKTVLKPNSDGDPRCYYEFFADSDADED